MYVIMYVIGFEKMGNLEQNIISELTYFLEYFPQVLLFSDRINPRVQFKGGNNSRAGTIYFAPTSNSVIVGLGCANAVLLIVYYSFVVLKLSIASKWIISSTSVSLWYTHSVGTIRGRDLFRSMQASELMREQFEGGKYSRKYGMCSTKFDSVKAL